MTRAKTRKRRPLLTLMLILALIPLGGVVLHRFVPPLFTILMVQQAAAGQGLAFIKEDKGAPIVALAMSAGSARITWADEDGLAGVVSL